MEWTFPDAEANLEQLLDLAIADGPQHVRFEDGALVVLTEETFQRLSERKPTLKELILNAPDFSGVDLSRDQSPEREFEW